MYHLSMEVSDYFSPKEHFIVEDLFNFSNLDEDDHHHHHHHISGPSDNGNASAVVINGDISDSPTLTAGESYTSSLSSYGHHLSPDFPEPCEEVAELEWLSNFMEDCFSNKEYHQQYFSSTSSSSSSSSSSSNPAQIPAMPSVPAKTRSKRSRANPTNWASRLLPILPHQPEPVAVPVQVLPQPESSEGEGAVRRCVHCGSDKTPQWRMGPMGPKTLCNACGVRFKSGRLVPEYRPAASPTFVVSEHSNSHRKVVELRRQKEMQHKKKMMMFWSSAN